MVFEWISRKPKIIFESKMAIFESKMTIFDDWQMIGMNWLRLYVRF